MSADPKNSEKKLGTVRIAPGVLASIVTTATKGVPGVLRMGDSSTDGSLSRFFGLSDDNHGVKIAVEDNKVKADLYLVVSREANLLQVGKQVQTEVSKAVRLMVGMPVEQINVHIQNVE